MRLWTPVALCAALVAAFGPAVRAEDVVLRFQAVQAGTYLKPSPGTVTAQAAGLQQITGRFGYSTDAPRTAEAGIPGQVAFASYATGFVTVDGLDLTEVPGSVTTSVTDGMAQPDDPATAIDDNVTIGFSAFLPGETVDSVSLRLLYAGADALQDVALPTGLDLDEVASIGLTFSTRVDVRSDRDQTVTDSDPQFSAVTFEVIDIERVQ